MAPLLLDPNNPVDGIADVESVLSVLNEITPVSLSPTAERGRRVLLASCVESVVAVLRHLGYETDGAI
jgi:hypothetical protein